MKKDKEIRIKITLVKEVNQSFKTRDSFWKQVHSDVELSEDAPINIEYKVKSKLGQNLKNELVGKFNKSLRDFDNLYYSHLKTIYLDEPFHFIFRRKEINDISFQEYFNSIVKLQEQKNEYFKDNTEYQKLLNKSLLASQIEFRIENISYSSLNLSLVPDSIEKLANVFDNNFELFYTFLEVYLPGAFRNSIGIYDEDKLPVNIQYDCSESLKTQFENSNLEKSQVKIPANNITQNTNAEIDKMSKAKWYWLISNLSLVVPVIIAIVVFYIAYNKIDSIEKLRQENYKEIKTENEKITKEYQELIETQKETYKSLIDDLKKDSIK